MQLRAKPLLEGEAGPFVVVALQVNKAKSYASRRAWWVCLCRQISPENGDDTHKIYRPHLVVDF